MTRDIRELLKQLKEAEEELIQLREDLKETRDKDMREHLGREIGGKMIFIENLKTWGKRIARPRTKKQMDHLIKVGILEPVEWKPFTPPPSAPIEISGPGACRPLVFNNEGKRTRTMREGWGRPF